MPRPPRAEIFCSSEISICHVVQRCVRRAFLAGTDDVSGNDYSYRREWIRQRIEKLASVFGIDVLTYAIMSNHLHVVLRNRPDVVSTWSDRQVALRWLQLFPGKRIEDQLGDPTTTDVDCLAKDEKRIATVRERLSDISWFMKALSEPIARMANKAEKCTGAFWEGRFKAQRILDESALLACCMYVDLNPIRAAIAQSPEKSTFTGVYDRMGACEGKKVDSCAAPMQTIPREEAVKLIRNSSSDELAEIRKKARKRKGPRVLRDSWLAPLTLDRQSIGTKAHKDGLRASDKGFLEMSFSDYLKLLTWTGQQRRTDKLGLIPADYVPIFERLGVRPEMWTDLVWDFKKYFGRSRGAGSPDSVGEMVAADELTFQPGQRLSRKCFV